MAFKKRESQDLTDAQKRAAGLLAIDPTGNLDLGNDHTQAAFDAQIKKVADALATHNTALSVVDKTGNALKAEEKKLRKLSSGMLTAVGQRYTLDSDEYEQAGGTRESERKRPGRVPKAPKA